MFEEIVRHTIKAEGGFTNDPNDSGNWTGGKVGVGELKGTKYGISAKTFQHIDIENLTENHAITLYRNRFWNPLKLDLFDRKLACLWFDMAVNHGVHGSTKVIQRAVGVKADGISGKNTRAAIAKAGSGLVHRIQNRRILLYTRLAAWNRYGKGWIRRACEIYRIILNG